MNPSARLGTDIARHVLFAALATAFVLGFPASGHCFYRYAVFDLENRSDIPMTYQLRWANDEWGRNITLAPGEGKLHSYALPIGGMSALPKPVVKFMPVGNIVEAPRVYDLVPAPSPQQSGYSRGYHFVVKVDGKKRFVDLVIRTAREEEAEGHFVRARQLEANGDWTNAIRQAERCLQLDPKAVAAHFIRGRCLSRLGQHDDGLDAFTAIVQIFPKMPRAYSGRAEVFVAKGQFQRAIEDYTRELEIDPTDDVSLNGRSFAYLRMREFDQAIADCNKVLKTNQKSALAIGQMGWAFYGKGDSKNAIAYLDQAVAIDPKLGSAFRLRGWAYDKLGSPSRAKEDVAAADRIGTGAMYGMIRTNEEALAALDAFPWGRSLSPETLEKANVQEDGVDPVKRTKGPASGTIPDPVKRLIRSEWSRFRDVKFEAVAAVNLFFTAARMTPERRAAAGMSLEWLFGPASSPIARQASNDDLGGLRIVGSLKFKDGRFINMIFARGYVPPDAERDSRGGIAFLEGGDNARLVAKVNKTGDVAKDFLFQSFSIDNPNKDTWSMRPAYALDELTGMLMSDKITESALSGRCMHCHSGGSNLSQKLRAKEAQDAAVEFYLGIAKTYGASFDSRGKGEKREVELLRDKMTTVGPLAVLPIEPLYQANRQHWTEIYPELLERRQTAALGGDSRSAKKK